MILGVLSVSLLALNPTSAYAQFRNDGVGWWYMQSNGQYTTGWIQDNGKWYYLGQDGYMKTGWQEYNGKYYYLNTDGSMAVNTTTPDGYKVDGNGVWIQNTTTTNSNNTNINSNNVNNTNTTNNMNSNNTTTVVNNINNGTIINGNVNIGNTTNINNNNSTTINNTQARENNYDNLFPCWTIINGKYYHINEDKNIDYNTTIDGYIIGADGAWIQNNSITPPNIKIIPYGTQIDLKQIIDKLEFNAKNDEIKKEVKEEKHQDRMEKIQQLQNEINDIKKRHTNNGEVVIQKYENEIKEIQLEDANDYNN
jgi:hypothetical protein